MNPHLPAVETCVADRGLRVEIATADDADRWDAAVRDMDRGSFYHLFAWRTINEESFGHRSLYLIARDSDRISGVLPMTLVASRMFGRILCSMPFVNFGGPCANDSQTLRLLLQSAMEIARQNAAGTLELRCATELDCDLSVSLRKVSMTLPLSGDPEDLWSAFTSKHRTTIRRALKNGLVVESGGTNLLREFYEVMELTWRDLGTPLYAREYFERILSTFPQETQIFVCRREGQPLAAALNGYFSGTVEGLWCGGVAEARSLQANYVLYWEMIRDACLRGCSRFHLGRSTAGSGAEDFKRKWNAERQQLYGYYWRPDGGTAAALNVDNPKFRLAISAWKRMPLALTRTIGPRVARCIP